MSATKPKKQYCVREGMKTDRLLLHKNMTKVALQNHSMHLRVWGWHIFKRNIQEIMVQYDHSMNFWLHRYKAIHLIRAYKSVYSHSLLRHGVTVQTLHTIMDHTCWSQPLSTPQQHLLFQVSPPSVTLLQEFIARFLPVTLLLVSLWVNND